MPNDDREYRTEELPCPDCAKLAPKLCPKHAEQARNRDNEVTPRSTPVRPLREG